MFTSYLIDESGFIRGQVFTDEPPSDEPNIVRTEPSEGLIRPKWTGKRWSEGALDEERAAALYSAQQGARRLFARVAEETRELLSPAGPHAHAVREQRLREARSMLYGQGQEEPFVLKLECAVTGVDLKSAAVRVLEEHKAWCEAMGRIEGQLRKYTSQVLDNESRQKIEGLVAEGCEAIRRAALPFLNPGLSSEPPPEEGSEGSPAGGSEVKEETPQGEGAALVESSEVKEETPQGEGAALVDTSVAIKDARPVEVTEAVKEAVSLSETRSVLTKVAPPVELATSRELVESPEEGSGG